MYPSVQTVVTIVVQVLDLITLSTYSEQVEIKHLSSLGVTERLITVFEAINICYYSLRGSSIIILLNGFFISLHYTGEIPGSIFCSWNLYISLFNEINCWLHGKLQSVTHHFILVYSPPINSCLPMKLSLWQCNPKTLYSRRPVVLHCIQCVFRAAATLSRGTEKRSPLSWILRLQHQWIYLVLCCTSSPSASESVVLWKQMERSPLLWSFHIAQKLREDILFGHHQFFKPSNGFI